MRQINTITTLDINSTLYIPGNVPHFLVIRVQIKKHNRLVATETQNGATNWQTEIFKIK